MTVLKLFLIFYCIGVAGKEFAAGEAVADEDEALLSSWVIVNSNPLVFFRISFPVEVRITDFGRNESFVDVSEEYGLMLTVSVASVVDESLTQ